MRTQIEKVLNLATFFKLKQSNYNNFIFNLEIPSRIILGNIHKNWLKSIFTKTKQHYPVYLAENVVNKKSEKQHVCYGYIEQCLPNEVEELNVNYSNVDILETNSRLKFNTIMLKQDAIQGFIQWQRYRKYWWSSITTTPGLFSVANVKYEDRNAYANISANFKWGQWIVETIKVTSHKNANNTTMELSCKLSLENSLLTLLLDASTNTRQEYLRLHNKMAPYKISFALNYKDINNFSVLQDLAKQIFYKLKSTGISTWLPEFSLSCEPQIKENMLLGVTYTAILSEKTLENGIFHLMNSSTMLKEQVHLADFVSYAALLCGQI